jgi:hypothetical protein
MSVPKRVSSINALRALPIPQVTAQPVSSVSSTRPRPPVLHITQASVDSTVLHKSAAFNPSTYGSTRSIELEHPDVHRRRDLEDFFSMPKRKDFDTADTMKSRATSNGTSKTKASSTNPGSGQIVAHMAPKGLPKRKSLTGVFSVSKGKQKDTSTLAAGMRAQDHMEVLSKTKSNLEANAAVKTKASDDTLQRQRECLKLPLQHIALTHRYASPSGIGYRQAHESCHPVQLLSFELPHSDAKC